MEEEKEKAKPSGLVPINADYFDSKYHEQVFRYHLGPDPYGNHDMHTLRWPDEPRVQRWKPLWEELRLNCDAGAAFYNRIQSPAIPRFWNSSGLCYSAGIRVRSRSTASTVVITRMLRAFGFPEPLIDDLYVLTSKNCQTQNGFTASQQQSWLRDYQTEVMLTWLYYVEQARPPSPCKNPIRRGTE